MNLNDIITIVGAAIIFGFGWFGGRLYQVNRKPIPRDDDYSPSPVGLTEGQYKTNVKWPDPGVLTKQSSPPPPARRQHRQYRGPLTNNYYSSASSKADLVELCKRLTDLTDEWQTIRERERMVVPAQSLLKRILDLNNELKELESQSGRLISGGGDYIGGKF